MHNRQKLSLIGVTLATPALTAAGEPASARTPSPSYEQAGAIQAGNTLEASTILKLTTLSINPAEKLRIGGDSILLAQVSPMSGGTVVLAANGTANSKSNDRTNTDIPECHSPSARTGSGAAGAGKSNDRTNTDIPECRSPSAKAGSGATGAGKTNLRTNTDIPECHSPNSMSGSGAMGAGKANDRTNTDIPECRGPQNKN